ncbi:myosin heavy chain [Vairimorpha apis BRL 01]|uniref:Myosin heavy chain n=1 Tax=Vairimorpha apis BRL 01 TaxID=1037528 RepID=T0L2X6_9MICR|nr:myosin heavy chain [Vairimorpha apis BRL 01]
MKHKDTDDLCTIEDVQEDTVVDILYDRFINKCTYTHAGAILISVNPYTYECNGKLKFENGCEKDLDCEGNILDKYEEIKCEYNNEKEKDFKCNINKENDFKCDINEENDTEYTNNNNEYTSNNNFNNNNNTNEYNNNNNTTNQFINTYNNNNTTSKFNNEYKTTQINYQTNISLLNTLADDSLSSKTPTTIIISGESGSGKTENTKHLLNYLITKTNTTYQISEYLYSLNVVLECMGNARTVLNDNSSRVGKMIRLCIDDEIVSIKVETYLLEQFRVSKQDKCEYNFHVFYIFVEWLISEGKVFNNEDVINGEEIINEENINNEKFLYEENINNESFNDKYNMCEEKINEDNVKKDIIVNSENNTNKILLTMKIIQIKILFLPMKIIQRKYYQQ